MNRSSDHTAYEVRIYELQVEAQRLQEQINDINPPGKQNFDRFVADHMMLAIEFEARRRELEKEAMELKESEFATANEVTKIDREIIKIDEQINSLRDAINNYDTANANVVEYAGKRKEVESARKP